MTQRAAPVLGALLLSAALPVLACGICAEDKIAATYDHRSVQEALARDKVVVYCELAGVRDVLRARQAAGRVRGVDARTVLVSAQPAALSFVLDPKQQSAQSAVRAVQAALPAGGRISILMVRDREGGATGAPPGAGAAAAPARPMPR